MPILVIIHSKAILIKIIQTTFSLFNQFFIIVFKHKSILLKSILLELILSESIMSKSIISKAESNTHLKQLLCCQKNCPEPNSLTCETLILSWTKIRSFRNHWLFSGSFPCTSRFDLSIAYQNYCKI